MDDGLADEQAIERIHVERWQARHVQRGFFVDPQFGDAVRVTLRRHERCGRLREAQAPAPPLERDLPRGRGAEKDLGR